MRMLNKILYVNTEYSLFLSLILYPEFDKNIYLFDEGSLKKFEKKLENNYILKNFKKEKIKLLRYIKIRNFLKNLMIKLKNLEGYEIYLKDPSEYGQFFLSNFNNNFYLIEDGTANYCKKCLEKEIKKIKSLKFHKNFKKNLYIK